MMKNALLVALLALIMIMTAASAKVPAAIDVALSEIGAGSATEIRERLLKRSYFSLPPQLHERVLAALPSYIQINRITKGFTFRRASALLEEVLELYGRGGTAKLILYRSEVPQSMLINSYALVLSDTLAVKLTEEELLGIIAHEVGHTYFMEELQQAREQKDGQALKAVELKCDAVAVLTLVLLGRESNSYISGLQKREKLANQVGLSGKFSATHPEVRERAQFIERFGKLLVHVRMKGSRIPGGNLLETECRLAGPLK